MSIANMSPTPEIAAGSPGGFPASYATARLTPIVFDVVGEGVPLVYLGVSFDFGGGPVVVYDSAEPGPVKWQAGWTVHCTATPVTNGWHLSILPDGGWPGGMAITLAVNAVDANGVVIEAGEAPPDPVLESIAVTPDGDTLAVDDTVQLTATGTYDDASTEDLTADVTWDSSNDAVATVSVGGLVTAEAAGSATISATLGLISDSVAITVEADAPPEEEVPTQYEAVSPAQLHAQLGGYGSAAVWKYINLLNDTAAPLYPVVGTAILSASAGAVANIAGPLDSFDKAVQATDGQADGQWTGTVGAVDPAGNPFAMLCEVRFTALPGGNRAVCGHDAANDFLLQYMQTTGRLRIATAGTVGSFTSGEITANHNDGNWHTVLAVYRPTVGMLVASDLGISTAGTAPAGMSWSGGIYIFRNSNGPPARVSMLAFAISDGSTEQNDAIASLYTNAAAAVAAYRTNTGR